MVFSDLIDVGKRFHKAGAATTKERWPIVIFVLIPVIHKKIPLLFRRKLQREAYKTDIKSVR